MSVAADNENLSFLHAQLEGLESIFYELIPFGIPLKRQQIQEYYANRLHWVTNTGSPAKNFELRRQFNSKANQVRNIVDGAETLGNAQYRFNLIYSGSSLPIEREAGLSILVRDLCRELLEGHSFDLEKLKSALESDRLTAAEARLLLGSAMFLVVDEVAVDGHCAAPSQLLEELLNLIVDGEYLESEDPFRHEARVLLESLKSD
jgi:hypothetical protein